MGCRGDLKLIPGRLVLLSGPVSCLEDSWSCALDAEDSDWEVVLHALLSLGRVGVLRAKRIKRPSLRSGEAPRGQ